MGTTAEKLAYLQETKEAIKDAIVNKGVEVTEDTTFREYATKIGEISGGTSDEYVNINLIGSGVDFEYLGENGWQTVSAEHMGNDYEVDLGSFKVKKGSFIFGRKTPNQSSNLSTILETTGRILKLGYVDYDRNILEEPELWYCLGDGSIKYMMILSDNSGGSGM